MRKHGKTHVTPGIGFLIFPIVTIAIVALIFGLSISREFKPNWRFDWSDIRPEVKDTVLYLAHFGEITTGVVGYSAVKTKRYDTRMWLMNFTTDSELNALRRFPEGNIKATVYETLLRRGKEDPIELLEECLSDSTAFFNYVNGCTGWETLTSEYIIHRVLNLKEAADSTLIVNLSLEHKEQLLSDLNKLLERKWQLYDKYLDPQ